MVSKPLSLNKTDYKKIAKDALVFFSVPILFYLFQVHGTVTSPNHVAGLVDFVPSGSTIVAVEAWFVGQCINAVKKFIS